MLSASMISDMDFGIGIVLGDRGVVAGVGGRALMERCGCGASPSGWKFCQAKTRTEAHYCGTTFDDTNKKMD